MEASVSTFSTKSDKSQPLEFVTLFMHYFTVIDSLLNSDGRWVAKFQTNLITMYKRQKVSDVTAQSSTNPMLGGFAHDQWHQAKL